MNTVDITLIQHKGWTDGCEKTHQWTAFITSLITSTKTLDECNFRKVGVLVESFRTQSIMEVKPWQQNWRGNWSCSLTVRKQGEMNGTRFPLVFQFMGWLCPHSSISFPPWDNLWEYLRVYLLGDSKIPSSRHQESLSRELSGGHRDLFHDSCGDDKKVLGGTGKLLWRWS